MNRKVAIIGLAVLLAATSTPALAVDLSANIGYNSQYIYRGIPQANSSAFGGLDLTAGGFYLGAWGSTMDINNGPTRQRDQEVNFYAGYLLSATDSLRFSATAVAYAFPGQTGNVDYNYQEYSLTGNYDDLVWLEFAYSPDLYNTGYSSTNIDLYAEWPINNDWAIGVGAGHYDTSDLTGESYQYWQLGVTRSFRWVDVDLRFHDTDTWVPIISNPDRAKSRVVLKIQIPF